MRSSSTGDIACSSRSASSWTSSQGMPRTSVRKRSIRRWRRTIASASVRPLSVKFRRLVRGALDVAVALEPADHLVHRRGRELHRAGDVGAGDRQPGLLEPEHDLEVLLLSDCRLVGGHRNRSYRGAVARQGVSAAPRLGSRLMQIDGQTRAIVTGASQGIGRATALALAARGATIGLVSRGADGLAALAAEIGDRAVELPADVGDREAIESAVAAFTERTGGAGAVGRQRRHRPLRAVRRPGPRRRRPDGSHQRHRHDQHGPRRAGTDDGSRPRPHRRDQLGRGASSLPLGRGLRRDQGRQQGLRRGDSPRAFGDRGLDDHRLPG